MILILLRDSINKIVKKYTLRDLPASERPRERLAKYGPESLSTSELLAIIIKTGSKKEGVMSLSQRLLSEFGSLENLQSASLEQLQQIEGIKIAKSSQLVACFEIARRLNNVSNNTKIKDSKRKSRIISPDVISEMLSKEIGHYKKEHFVVVSLDTRNNIIGIDKVSIGTLNAGLVHPRETFEIAIKRHAASIILSHNHPSGDSTPSDEDIKVTAKLQEAGKLMGIEVLDHIIIGKDSYFSFTKEN